MRIYLHKTQDLRIKRQFYNFLNGLDEKFTENELPSSLLGVCKNNSSFTIYWL